jgi:seryl-tRNA synthetase
VKLQGEVTKKGRMVRQSEADLKSLQEEGRKLQEELERANADRNENLKRIGRERRQWDVDRQALVEKCGGLSNMVILRDKQDESKKRQHKLAMAKANEMCTKLKAKMKDILQQEKESVTLAMTRVTSDQKKVNKMDDRLQQRADNLLREAKGIERDRCKVETAKKVVVAFVLVFSSL